MIRIRCPYCGAGLDAQHGQRGRFVRCPECAMKFRAEAESWWDRTSHGDSRRRKDDAKPVRDKKEAIRSRGILRPYQQVDQESLDQIPDHRKMHRAILGVCLIACTGVIVLLLWLYLSAGSTAAPSSKSPEDALAATPADTDARESDAEETGGKPLGEALPQALAAPVLLGRGQKDCRRHVPFMAAAYHG